MLRALWLAVGLAVLAYGYFAFGPTGYGAFVAKHSRALIWADRLLSLTEDGKASAAAVETTDLIKTLEDFGASPPPAGVDPPGFGLWFGQRFLFSAEDFVSGSLRETVSENARAHGQIAAVVELVRQTLARQALSTQTPAVDDGTLDPTLDRLETVLLAQRWSTPEFRKFPTLDESRMASYDYWAAFAILRAVREDRGEAASEMLTRYLESLRILHHGQYPVSDVSFTVAQRLLLSLSRTKSFPSHGLERARDVVRRIRLSAEELQTIRVAHALRWHDKVLQDLDEERIPSKDNTWDRFLFGWPAQLTQKVFEPIQRRSADRISKAWAEDSMAFEPRWENILTPSHGLVNPLAVRAGTSIVMNQDHARYSDHYELGRPVNDRLLDLTHGGRARWLELVLALSFFEREHGGPPREMGQLVPRYLDPEFLEERDVSWSPDGQARAVWTIEAIENDRGQITPVICRWVRGELTYRRREGGIRPFFAWTTDHLDEVPRQPVAMFPTPEQPTSLEIVDLTVLLPLPR